LAAGRHGRKLLCDAFRPRRILMSVTPTSAFAIDVPAALLDRARRGDAAAYEQLYRWFERPVFTLALRLTGQREEAQDVLQDTMLKLFDRLPEFRGDSPFWGWLRQVAVNEALMRLRKRGRFGPDVEFEEADLEAQETLLPPRAADAALLARAGAALPGATRPLLLLYHAQGETPQVLGGLTGRTISFSKSQLARGTRRLRAELHIEPGVVHG
jgi:RNA polymerase sigma-70 factor (ECF subfamily)